MAKLWGGRFGKELHQEVLAFTSSIATDQRLWPHDIQGSQAHARMLGKCGIISLPDSEQIVRGLDSVAAKLSSGEWAFQAEAEDVHSEVERLLASEIGELAGKLHTARSRNDQVLLSTKLYLRAAVTDWLYELQGLRAVLKDLAKNHLNTLLPGLTHTQHAQPVSLAHHLMAYFWMLHRDGERLIDYKKRLNKCPLGVAALAGTGFSIDRQMVAKELQFDGVTENSLDTVGDRDFILELLSITSITMTHFSRLAEEFILWSTPEFGFLTLDDSVTTGSSIMPNKKNPDVAELIRGRTGVVFGQLMAALTLMKAVPLSYNRDFQEDKELIFKSLDILRGSTRMFVLMLENAKFHPDKMAKSLMGDTSNATDLADYLAKKGLPFRQAHEVVGKIVLHCALSGQPIESLDLMTFHQFSPLFESDVLSIVLHRAVMEARTSEGGTAPDAVSRQIKMAE
ncbi:MAG: argininosuccinate lyase [Bdellovibrionales bacterium]|nr:argininosuccinate lyase [Bdellovibrionales bacterium]